MKIYTKKGDAGETSLVGGKRVSKASARVNAYGEIDELISMIGVLRCEDPDFDKELKHIQEVLMAASAHIASEGNVAKLAPFHSAETEDLEKKIDRMISEIPPQKAFILPGQPHSASIAHVARSICRRAERACVALKDERIDVVSSIKFLNRLSDYLFTLARFLSHKNNILENFWTV